MIPHLRINLTNSLAAVFFRTRVVAVLDSYSFYYINIIDYYYYYYYYFLQLQFKYGHFIIY